MEYLISINLNSDDNFSAIKSPGYGPYVYLTYSNCMSTLRNSRSFASPLRIIRHTHATARLCLQERPLLQFKETTQPIDKGRKRAYIAKDGVDDIEPRLLMPKDHIDYHRGSEKYITTNVASRSEMMGEAPDVLLGKKPKPLIREIMQGMRKEKLHRSRPNVRVQTRVDDLQLRQVVSGILGVQDHEEAQLLTRQYALQAVTHKSWDHGKQPYNEQLAFLGRRTIFAQLSRYLLENKVPLQEMTMDRLKDTLHPNTIGRLAESMGMVSVMRWSPTHRDPKRSGMQTVMARCYEAIFGAVLMHRGSEVVYTLLRDNLFPKLLNKEL